MQLNLEEFGYCAVELYFSAVCNLKCIYCFQPSVPQHMKKVNEEIKEWISSGQVEKDILKYLGPNVAHISFWGGEPSINLPYLTPRLETFINNFPKLEEFNYSTNLSTRELTQSSIDFIKALASYNRKYDKNIKLRFQISLDGAPFINDPNRIGSSAEQIIDNVLYLMEALGDDYKVIEDSAHFKATVSSEGLALLSQEDLVYKNYKFFDDFYTEASKIREYYPSGAEATTFANPGNYNEQDGKNLEKFTRIQSDLKFHEHFKNEMSYRNQISSNFFNFLVRMKSNQRSVSHRAFSGCINCSAGKTNFGLDHKGNFFICHNSFFLDEEMMSFIEKTELKNTFTEKIGFDFRLYNSRVKKFTEFNFEKDSDLKKLQVLSTLSQGSWEPHTRYQYLTLLTKEMAAYGQISEEYLKDDKLRDMLVAFYLYGGNSCSINNYWETGTIHLGGTSWFRLVGNGAFEYLMDHEVTRDFIEGDNKKYAEYFR